MKLIAVAVALVEIPVSFGILVLEVFCNEHKV